MKRILLAAVLLFGGGLAAQADTSVYHNILKQARGDAALQADTQYCDQHFGVVQNGAATPVKYKKCMRGRGWSYQYTKREHTWIDPDTGLTCKEILGGIGSECSNF